MVLPTPGGQMSGFVSGSTRDRRVFSFRSVLSRHYVSDRSLALAGVVGPILFWAVLVILGQSQFAYNPYASDISLLALGTSGWIQTVNFVVFGLLSAAFQIGLQRAVAPGHLWGLINILAVGCGLALTAIAIFPTDRTGTWTLHGVIHLGVVAALGELMPSSCLATAAKVKSNHAWHGYARFSVAVGMLTGMLTVVLLVPGMKMAVPFHA